MSKLKCKLCDKSYEGMSALRSHFSGEHGKAASVLRQHLKAFDEGHAHLLTEECTVCAHRGNSGVKA